MSTLYQVLETCDRCGWQETISYESYTAFEGHKTTFANLHVDTKPDDRTHKGEVSARICMKCANSALEWFGKKKAQAQ